MKDSTGILLPVIGICRCMVVCCGLDIWRVLWVVLSWRFTGQLEARMFGFRIICFWNRVYPCFFPNQWNIVFPCAVIYYFGYWASNYFSNHFQNLTGIWTGLVEESLRRDFNTCTTWPGETVLSLKSGGPAGSGKLSMSCRIEEMESAWD